MWISQLVLIGLLSTKKAADSTPLLAALPLLTYGFHKYCKSRFEPAFRKYPLEVPWSNCIVLVDFSSYFLVYLYTANLEWLVVANFLFYPLKRMFTVFMLHTYVVGWYVDITWSLHNLAFCFKPFFEDANASNLDICVKFQEAMEKDNMEKTSEPDLNLRSYLADAYLHPIFRSFEDVETQEVRVDKNQTHFSSPTSTETSSPSPPPQYVSSPQYVYHYEFEP